MKSKSCLIESSSDTTIKGFHDDNFHKKSLLMTGDMCLNYNWQIYENSTPPWIQMKKISLQTNF